METALQRQSVFFMAFCEKGKWCWLLSMSNNGGALANRAQDQGPPTAGQAWAQHGRIAPSNCLFAHAHTSLSSIGALRPPDCRIGWVWAEVIELVSSSLILLVYLCEVVHAQAAQLFCDGTLTLTWKANKKTVKTSEKECRNGCNTLMNEQCEWVREKAT